MGEQRLEHVGDARSLLEWLEEDGTHHEWLSAAAAHGRKRVPGSKPEKVSWPALKWTPRFMGLGGACGCVGQAREWMEKADTSDATAGEEQDGVGQRLVMSERRPRRGEEPRGRPSKLGTPVVRLLEHSGVAVRRVGGGHDKRREARDRAEAG
jgi:hypothetical protein